MMNNRNTEGYVLAYLLIVITVMGLIAATLMASTVQVMSAQQNSIRYMQDKYAAMGEIEKLWAEIEDTFARNLPANSSDGIAEFTSSQYEDSSDARSNAKSKLTDLITTAVNVNLNLPQEVDSYFSHTNTCTFSYVFNSGSTTVAANLHMPYTITINSHNELDEDPNDPDTTIVVDTDYSYTLLIKSLDLISYEISTVDNTSNEEGDDNG